MKPGRLLLFDVARTYCRDLAGVDAAQDFLQFKLSAAEHARERILMVVNRGVTTFATVIDPATGRPTNATKESHDPFGVMELRMWFDLLLFELASIEDALVQAANVVFELPAFTTGLPLSLGFGTCGSCGTKRRTVNWSSYLNPRHGTRTRRRYRLAATCAASATSILATVERSQSESGLRSQSIRSSIC
jgi:hypothetical protein